MQAAESRGSTREVSSRAHWISFTSKGAEPPHLLYLEELQSVSVSVDGVQGEPHDGVDEASRWWKAPMHRGRLGSLDPARPCTALFTSMKKEIFSSLPSRGLSAQGRSEHSCERRLQSAGSKSAVTYHPELLLSSPLLHHLSAEVHGDGLQQGEQQEREGTPRLPSLPPQSSST